MCGSMAGEIRKPLVIGKSKKPRCFKSMDISSLPVISKFNKKAWMTTEIMEQWLRYFNTDTRSQNRNVLIFLDNAACHPKIELSNIKILMLPPKYHINHPTNGSRINLHVKVLTIISFCYNHYYARWIILLQPISFLNQ